MRQAEILKVEEAACQPPEDAAQQEGTVLRPGALTAVLACSLGSAEVPHAVGGHWSSYERGRPEAGSSFSAGCRLTWHLLGIVSGELSLTCSLCVLLIMWDKFLELMLLCQMPLYIKMVLYIL